MLLLLLFTLQDLFLLQENSFLINPLKYFLFLRHCIFSMNLVMLVTILNVLYVSIKQVALPTLRTHAVQVPGQLEKSNVLKHLQDITLLAM